VLVADREFPGGGIDTGDDEASNRKGLRDVPVALHDRDRVVFVDVAEERDASFRYWKRVEATFVDVGVEVEPVGEPSELISNISNVLGWVFSTEAGLVEDGTVVVGPVKELVCVGAQLVEGVVVPPVDRALSPQTVDVLDMVREPERSRWRHDDFDTEHQQDLDPQRPRIVGMRRPGKSVVSAHSERDRHGRPRLVDKVPYSVGDRAMEILTR